MHKLFQEWWDCNNCDFDIYNFPKDSMEGAFVAGMMEAAKIAETRITTVSVYPTSRDAQTATTLKLEIASTIKSAALEI